MNKREGFHVKNIKKFTIQILKFTKNENTPHYWEIKNIHIFCKARTCGKNNNKKAHYRRRSSSLSHLQLPLKMTAARCQILILRTAIPEILQTAMERTSIGTSPGQQNDCLYSPSLSCIRRSPHAGSSSSVLRCTTRTQGNIRMKSPKQRSSVSMAMKNLE
ncbi:unnamed protein product [Nesidiocoris tenuis]|uniref:Uncharacterized protein n=1 Tax=Nesidiocoris tenuis TaxID=355587 RepID=A0A6H5HHJ2_9HEMI|nr:unnamed protein product [Nesidiocoris tenuis]